MTNKIELLMRQITGKNKKIKKEDITTAHKKFCKHNMIY